MTEPRELTRRRAIQQTALAAGLLWTTPAIRSVRLGAVGSPPPTTTSSTTVSTTRYTFAGSWTTLTDATDWATCLPDSIPIGRLATGVLPVLGASTMTLHLCFTFEGAAFVEGTFALDAENGSVSGTLIDGALIPADPSNPTVFDWDVRLAITDGTGQFASASGNIHITGRNEPRNIEGTIDVPN